MQSGSAHFSILQNSPNSSPKRITADYAGFADVFSVAVGLWATQHYLCFSRQRDASHSEAATDEESETLQTEAVCFLFLTPQVTGRLAHCRPAQRVPLARLHNLAAYLLRACLSFHNDPDRKAGRRSLRRSRSGPAKPRPE